MRPQDMRPEEKPLWEVHVWLPAAFGVQSRILRLRASTKKAAYRQAHYRLRTPNWARHWGPVSAEQVGAL